MAGFIEEACFHVVQPNGEDYNVFNTIRLIHETISNPHASNLYLLGIL